jgi:hypothetical protein
MVLKSKILTPDQGKEKRRLHDHPLGDNLVLLLFLLRKNNNKHASAKRLIVPLRGTMVYQKEAIKRF